MLRNQLYKPWFAEERWGIEIIEGDFLGLVIEITEINFPDNQAHNCNIEYTTITESEAVKTEPELFETVLSTIVNDILKEAIEIYENDKNRTDHTSPANP